MISGSSKTLARTFLTLAYAAAVIVTALQPGRANAAERKFLVTLANSPKQFGGGLPPGGLLDPNLFLIQYFDKNPNNAIGSFAEYWEEISYGAVTIRGEVTDWINLPWAIQPQDTNPGQYVRFRPTGTLFVYGLSELFDTSRAKVIIDTNGDGPGGVDNGPFEEGPGSFDVTPISNQPVWRPGARFLDIDNDDRWDGKDEIFNTMDFDGDRQPDLDGPWIDLDGDGQPNNQAGCVYLADSDNDKNPDCCPNGPGGPGCGGIASDGDDACDATQWTLSNGSTFTDCNGNLIPDECDLGCDTADCLATGWRDVEVDGVKINESKCGGSKDELPVSSSSPFTCDAPNPNNVPDECEFENSSSKCANNEETDDGCNGTTTCVPIDRTPAPRCEYDDSDGNTTPGVVEPFESFIRIGNHKALGANGFDPDTGIELDPGSDEPSVADFAVQYIKDNYPGDSARLIADLKGRSIYGKHDPLGKTVGCSCANGQPCVTLGVCDGDGSPCVIALSNSDPCDDGSACVADNDLGNMCEAGFHQSYVSPDFWIEQGTSKMVANDDPIPQATGQPPWYDVAWRDRYHNATPPIWNAFSTAFIFNLSTQSPSLAVPEMVPFTGEDRRFFRATRGGLGGDGTQWLDNPSVAFESKFFEDAFSNARILPEETDGLTNPIQLFDGWVEHDDLPSSKYHQGGDQRLGEVTSPFGTDIWGQDLATLNPADPPNPDGIIKAAGPYAIRINGEEGVDAGNILPMEILTWRWEPPFNDGEAWEDMNGVHPYAGPSGENLGFRDFNLDGMIDQGQVRPIGSENYLVDGDPQVGRLPGTATLYPWNRQRLLEDVIEAIDTTIDFNDFVDDVALQAAQCALAVPLKASPAQYGGGVVKPLGVVSGIVLLPNGSHGPGDFLTAPRFYPIHNEDFSAPQSSPNKFGKINWNMYVHDLVIQVSANPQSTDGSLLTAYSAHEYLHSWERLPDLYDYDIFLPPGNVINTPVARFDIMGGSGQVPAEFVHPVPILKESSCPRWVDPVDLTTVLTPGVDTTITLPPAEFVRDDSYYFFENEGRPGERLYFWSAGSGFDRNMPGSGMLILHTDTGANPNALPSGQTRANKFEYQIEQADGLHQLEAGISPFGDAGDPWPGTSGATQFSCTTDPASQWYTLNQCTGLSVVDVQPQSQGRMLVTFNWQPTSIPTLGFIDPPGGSSRDGIYTIRVNVSDVFGGTTIRFYYTTDRQDTTITGTNFIGELQKSNPGQNELAFDWNINGLPDGRYFLFAELIPGPGTGGVEKRLTSPRAGRNNTGNGTMAVSNVDIEGFNARLETWIARCISADGLKWLITGTLSQLAEASDDISPDPAKIATTGAAYTSIGGAVTFTISAGSTPFTTGDSFAYTTTGITAVSAGISIISGLISENPIAEISASVVTGKSPLTVVFDGRGSRDPEGRELGDLTFEWNFGDGSPIATGIEVPHDFIGSQTFTVTLSVIDPLSGRVGEASVDIVLENNSPIAVLTATPTSGPLPLDVEFSAAQSSDKESSAATELIYEWEFGDGSSAGSGVPGQFVETSHSYLTEGEFAAALTVTDPGGKSSVATIRILVGNTRPTAVITHSSLTGPNPLEVFFNAIESRDPDNDSLTITWSWGDGTADESYPPTGPSGVTDGTVPHTYQLPSGDIQGSFTTTVLITDSRGASTEDSFKITVLEAGNAVGNKSPSAVMVVSPSTGQADTVFTFDGSGSVDPEGESITLAWNFGDGQTAVGTTVTHQFDVPGNYRVRLTVTDDAGAATSTTRTVSVTAVPGNRPPTAIIGSGPRSGTAPLTISFSGQNSFDPDNDVLSYRWQVREAGTLTEVQTGPILAVSFENPATYTIDLRVTDGRGGANDAETVTVVVGVPTQGPTTAPVQFDPSPTAPLPTRPGGGICGFGMITTFFATLLGLFATKVNRRRYTNLHSVNR